MTKKIQYKGNIIEFPDNVTNEQIVDFLKNGNFMVQVVEIIKGKTSLWGELIKG